MQPLLEQALHVSPETRKTWLKNLTKAQRTQLQAEMTAGQKARGIEPPTTVAPKMTKTNRNRYDWVRSGTFVAGQRAVRVGRHIVLLPSQSLYSKTRDTLLYTYYRGHVGGYVAKGAKLKKLTLDAESAAWIARSLFNVKI